MKLMKVLISDKLSSGAKGIFESSSIIVDENFNLTSDELISVIANYDGLVVRSSTQVNADLINKGKKLKIIGRAGIGIDNIDVSAATKKGILVMNTPHGNSVTTAEHTISLILSLARQIPLAHLSTISGKWEKQRFIGTEISGKCLGIIGCGNIGCIVAKRALGLEMKVLGYDPFLSNQKAKDLGIIKVDLKELLSKADFISLHTPLTEETRNIISTNTIGITKKGVRIINCARGGLVDEKAVLKGLRSGHIAGVALDVFSEEPSINNPLFKEENFVATPHLGASTLEAQEKVALQIAQQMVDFFNNGTITNSVNMPSISPEEALILKPFIKLSELLGRFLGQTSSDELNKFELELDGKSTKLNDQPLLTAALAGFFSQKMDSVNMVNSSSIASQKGVSTSVIKHDRRCDYESMIRINLIYNNKIRTIAGTLFRGDLPRIVELQGISVESNFPKNMLYLRNYDKPGFIGEFGSLIGELGINIASFHLGRKIKGGEAIAIVEVDENVKDDLLEKIRNLPQILKVDFLKFD